MTHSLVVGSGKWGTLKGRAQVEALFHARAQVLPFVLQKKESVKGTSSTLVGSEMW